MNRDHKTDWISWLDYIFVLRPMLFYPGWSTLLAGYFVRTGYGNFTIDWNPVGGDQHILFILLLCFACVMGSSFILNQLKDIETDRTNNKLFIVSGGLLNNRILIGEVVILTVVAVLLALSIGLTIAVLMGLFFIVTGIFYNFRPLVMKDRPWASLLANMIMGSLAFAVGWFTRYNRSLECMIDLLPYLFFNTALYLFTTLPDLEGDRRVDKKTLAVRYGPRAVIRAAFIIYLTGLVCGLVLMDWQALIFLFLSLPFFIKTIITNRTGDTLRATKYGILLFALSICLHWPVYFLLMIGGFYATRLYYRYRFNFNYPNFSGK